MAVKFQTKDGREIKVPETLEEVNDFLRRIADKRRQVIAASSVTHAIVSSAKKTLEAQIAPLVAEAERLYEGVFYYAQVNRDNLCPGDLKSVDLASGRIGWRWTPWRVNDEGVDVKALIKKFVRAKLNRFIRRPEPELNKQALLAEMETAGKQGIVFSHDELFFAKLHEADELVRPTSELKKTVG